MQRFVVYQLQIIEAKPDLSELSIVNSEVDSKEKSVFYLHTWIVYPCN